MNRGPEFTGRRPRYWAAFTGWLLLAALPAAAQVGPLTTQSLFFDQASNAHLGNYLAVEGGLIYTDNAELSQHGSSGAVLGLLGLVGDLIHEGSRLDYRLDSDLAVVRYSCCDFPTEVTGFLDGTADLKIVPGTFLWTARETYSQQQIDPFLPPTPDNLENINYTSTGPSFILRPTLRTTIRLDALASYVYTSSPSNLYINIDSWRYSGDLTLERAFTSASSAYVKGTVTRVDFTDTSLVPVPEQTIIGIVERLEPLNSDYTLGTGVLGWKYNDLRTVFDASGGVTSVHVNNETFRGATWNVNLSRLITPTQRISLLASQTLTDTVNLLRQNLNQAVPTVTAERLANGQPFTNRSYGADWRFQANRTAVELSLVDSKQTYELDQTFNLHSKFASALVARQLNPVMNWDVGVRYEHQVYATGGGVNFTSAVTNLRWRVGPKVELRFLYAHTWQSPGGYTDNQVGVTASYALIGERGQVGGPAGLTTPLLGPMAPMSALPATGY